MTDIVTVPDGDFTPGAQATLEFSAALINAAWAQANAKYTTFETKMGNVTTVVSAGATPVTATAATAVDPTDPGVTNLPTIPSVSDAPTAPTLPTLVALPAAPTAPTAPTLMTLPAAPTLPTIPDLPGVPTAPSMPTLVALPTIPDAPVMPALAVLPTAPTLPTLAAATVMTLFDDTQQDLWDQLVAGIDSFRASYFPEEQANFDAAEAWLAASLASPSGLPAAVAAQMLTDDKDRIMADASRAADSLMAKFAGARFPMPTGALASAVLQVQQAAQAEVASSSRKITIASIENLRFAVTQLVGLRQIALGAALEYVKTLASGMPIAGQVVGTSYDAQAKTYDAQIQSYSTQVQAFNASVQAYSAQLQPYEAKVRAYSAQVQAYGEQVKPYSAQVQAYSAAVQAYTAEAQTHSVLLQPFAAAVESYSAQVQARNSDIQAYDAQTKAYSANVQSYSSQVQAFGEQVQPYSAQVQAYSAQVQARAGDIQLISATGNYYGTQGQLIGAASQYYNARTAAAEMLAKNAQFNAEKTLQAATSNQAASLAVIENQVKAMVSEAQSLAQMTTALFNNLQASSGTSYYVNGT